MQTTPPTSQSIKTTLMPRSCGRLSILLVWGSGGSTTVLWVDDPRSTSSTRTPRSAGAGSTPTPIGAPRAASCGTSCWMASLPFASLTPVEWSTCRMPSREASCAGRISSNHRRRNGNCVGTVGSKLLQSSHAPEPLYHPFVGGMACSAKLCGPQLVPHHCVVGHHFRDCRSFRQQEQLIGRLRPKLPAVRFDRRTRPRLTIFRTDRRAAAQPDRGETEGGAPPPSAFARHGFSPWRRGVRPAGWRA